MRNKTNRLTMAGYDGYPLHLAQTRSSGESSVLVSTDRSADFPVNRISQYLWLILTQVFGLKCKTWTKENCMFLLVEFFSVCWWRSADTHQTHRRQRSHSQGLWPEQVYPDFVWGGGRCSWEQERRERWVISIFKFKLKKPKTKTQLMFGLVTWPQVKLITNKKI